ncbi:hypothetical protein MUG78_12580 [Gordonia alkaliphila]|nr:hypothetical protein [Gordonia alkaliphila]MCK0440262.1 hypothetical protein [Gordonia alkaliphila]
MAKSAKARKAKRIREHKAREKTRRETRRDGARKVDGLAEARAVLTRALVPSRERIDVRIEEARAFERWRVDPSPPEDGSSIALDDSGEWQGELRELVSDSLVFDHALFPAMAAADNLTTVVAAVDEWDGTGVTRSISVIALCRAVMEAASRTIWVLSSEDRDERRDRALRITKDEVLRQKKFAEALSVGEGTEGCDDGLARCKKVLDELDNASVRGAQTMEQMIVLAAGWVDENAPNRDNRPMGEHVLAMYSITSGVAHGHTWPTRYLTDPNSLFSVIADSLYVAVTLLGAAVVLYEAQATATGNIGSKCPATLRDAARLMYPRYAPGASGLTPFRRSSRYESRPVARGRGQGDWSDHDEQQEASHPGAGRP